MNSNPWDLYRYKDSYVPEDEYNKRFDICQKCDNFINITSQCKKCGCFMNLKCKLPNASCPIGLWKEYLPE